MFIQTSELTAGFYNVPVSTETPSDSLRLRREKPNLAIGKDRLAATLRWRRRVGVSVSGEQNHAISLFIFMSEGSRGANLRFWCNALEKREWKRLKGTSLKRTLYYSSPPAAIFKKKKKMLVDLVYQQYT